MAANGLNIVSILLSWNEDEEKEKDETEDEENEEGGCGG